LAIHSCSPTGGTDRASSEVSCEIANAVDLISWTGERLQAKGRQVEPLVRRAFQATLVQVARGGPRPGIGGGPAHDATFKKHVRLAGPSAPRLTTRQTEFDLTPRLLKRAERRRYTRPPNQHALLPVNGAGFLLKTGAEFLIGPTSAVSSSIFLRPSRIRPRNLGARSPRYSRDSCARRKRQCHVFHRVRAGEPLLPNHDRNRPDAGSYW
jgi:hypothetical protein